MAKQPLDHLRSRKKQVYVDVPIPDDVSYLTARDEARSRVNKLEVRDRVTSGANKGQLDPVARAELEEAKEALEAAEADLRPHLLWFRITSLPPKQYDKLVSQHPPTAEQRKEAKRAGIMELAYNWDTFLPELVTRCVSFAYRINDDGEVENAYPDPETGKFGDDVMFEPITKEFLDEMLEEGAWSQGEITVLTQGAANINNNIRDVGSLGNV